MYKSRRARKGNGKTKMLVTGKEILDHAKKENYAVLAPDFWDSNSIRVFIKAAQDYKQPLMLSFPEALIPFLSLEEAALLGRGYASKATVKVALHLDHGTNLENIKKAIDLGFTSVMIDASNEALEENIRKTKEIVEYAHNKGVSVEAEIGHVGTNESYFDTDSKNIYTQADQAKSFVDETHVDSLAVSIGTSHGVYTNGTPHINFDILKEIKESVGVPLVLHGGSGIGDDNLKKCSHLGINKINVFTDFITASMYAVSQAKPNDWIKMLVASNTGILKVLNDFYKVIIEDK